MRYTDLPSAAPPTAACGLDTRRAITEAMDKMLREVEGDHEKERHSRELSVEQIACLATQRREEMGVDGRREVEMALFLCRPGSNLATRRGAGGNILYGTGF